MSELKNIEKQIEKLRKQKEILENSDFRKNTLPNMKLMVGKTFKFRNCYSCPSKESDYWWMYCRIIAVVEDERDAGFSVATIQKDEYGNIEASMVAWMYPIQDAYIEIGPEEYDNATNDLYEELGDKLGAGR